MRILFVSILDPFDRGSWSGVPAHMLDALKKTGVSIEVAEPLRGIEANLITRLMGLWPRFKAWNCRRRGIGVYEIMRDPVICGLWARQVRWHIDRVKPGIVLSLSSLPVARLRTDIPVVIWPDATFDGMLDFYWPRTDFAPSALRNGHRREQEALGHASAIVYPTDWAADTARRFYKVDHAKIHVIPYGCNLSDPPPRVEVEAMIARRMSSQPECRLLFIGQDWVRKGGSQAVAVAEELNRQGIRCSLTIVGHHAHNDQFPPFVRYEGFLRKDVKRENRRLRQLLSESHFLIGPSIADCGGMVFAEGAAFGVPSLSTKQGGTPTVIRDGINGKTFALDAQPIEYARFIIEMLNDNVKYLELCRLSRNEYETRLNWNTACNNLVGLCRTVAS
jgi:glycosyltransferase involved in cell wall biosynthesis